MDISKVSKNTFCVEPWIGIRIRPDGTLYYCHASRGPFKEEIDKLNNIRDLDLDHYYSSASCQQIQNDLLQGRTINGCSICYNAEKKLEFSFRQRRNLQMAIFSGKHFEKSFKESTIQTRLDQRNTKPMFYNITLSNLCNLGCVMCNEDWSSRLAQDFKKINVQHGSKFYPIQTKVVDWSQDSDVWQRFLSHMINNKEKICVHFQGGEPMLHKRFSEFIDHSVESNDVDYHLTLVSNGTIYNEDLLKKFSKFKSCQLEISIENLSPSNEYIRYPVNNHNLRSNIVKFLQHRNDQLDVVIRTVPQLLSVIGYDTILEFCLENQLIIDSNRIENPVFFAPNLLPDNIKHMVISKLEAFRSRLTEKKPGYLSSNIRNKEFLHQSLNDNINLVIGLITEPVPDNVEDLRCQAVMYLHKLDNLRKNSAIESCPELKEFIQHYEQPISD
jgi:organic radical activating enzyme